VQQAANFLLLDIFFQALLLVKYLELRQNPHMPYHVLNYAEHDGDLTFS
jgi:hypothetical protein